MVKLINLKKKAFIIVLLLTIFGLILSSYIINLSTSPRFSWIINAQECSSLKANCQPKEIGGDEPNNDDRRKQLEEKQKEIDELEAKLREISSTKKTLNNQINYFNNQIKLTGLQILQTEKQIVDLQA